MITIKLPDGNTIDFEQEVALIDIAKKISPSLAKKCIFARVDDIDRDMSYIVKDNSNIKFFTETDKESFAVLNHSSAHILAEAVLNIKPNAKVTIGPAIEEGFYYDIDFSGDNFIESDLLKIEKEMKKIILSNAEFTWSEVSKEEALNKFKGNEYKEELINNLPDSESITVYKQNNFEDLCRGVHIPSTKFVKSFKLLSLAGSYWRGDSTKAVLQRIYGVSFFNDADLNNHLEILAERKERDHRKIGKDLKIFANFPKVANGMPFYLPNGFTLRKIIEDYLINLQNKFGYQHVLTPSLGSEHLYETSGHLSHYSDDMFPVISRDNENYYLRPMNCPHHHQIYDNELRSYRDLPVRIAEFGQVYRWESSGSLIGLERARGFVQNDAHIYLSKDQINSELKNFINMFNVILDKFDIEVLDYRLSLYDPENKDKYYDNPKIWEESQNIMREALKEIGLDFAEEIGEAAFYGPKLDIQVRTAIGHEITFSTWQLDFLQGEKFDLKYINSKGEKETVIIVHHALIGSIDRFIALVLESTKGIFPLWLAPKQIAIIPVSIGAHLEYSKKINDLLFENGLRSFIDEREEKLSYKIRELQMQKIPFQAIIGDNEIQKEIVTLRPYGSEDNIEIKLNDLVEYINNLCK